jgi:hypothetical protein
VTATDPEGTSTARVAIQVVGLGASADTKAPELSASLTHRRFRVGRAATAIAAKRAPVGTTFRWRLSEPATVRLVFSRTARGRRVGKRCVKPTRRNAGRRLCRRTIAEGALTRASGVGAGRLAFSGRVGRRALRVGVHRARLVATDAAQNRSKPVVLSFRIVRR